MKHRSIPSLKLLCAAPAQRLQGQLKMYRSAVVAFSFICFNLLCALRASGVTPAPDGGYPGGNTAEGTDALHSLSSGRYNTANGLNALFNDTSGTFNTAIGVNALRANTTASGNTALGCNALYFNTTGPANTATGYQALFHNNGQSNTATGFEALYSNTSGIDNTAMGWHALLSNKTGLRNTAIGVDALPFNSNGGNNTGIGWRALYSNTGGNGNTAIGFEALYDNGGSFNTAIGYGALFSNGSDGYNVAVGEGALVLHTSGVGNTAVGAGALQGNTSGAFNIALGDDAGGNLATGNHNIYIGSLAGNNNESATIRIGDSFQTTTFIAGISGVAVTGSQVVVSSSGQLGVTPSSARFKEAVKPMDKTSEALLKLKPVTFRYKEELDPNKVPQFGLIAEEVEKVSPELVVRDEEGEAMTVRYEAVNAMLLNEFLKEHRKVENQQAIVNQLETALAKQQRLIASQQKEFEDKIAIQQQQIDALTAGLRRVNAKIELR